MPFWDKQVAPEYKQLPTMSPEQQSLFGQLMGGLGGQGGGFEQLMNYLKGLMSGDEGAYSKFEAPYMRQFQEEILPKLGEQFAGSGGLRSSAFGQQMGAQAAGLQERLAMMREGLRQQASGSLMDMFKTGIGTPTFQGMMTPGYTQQGWGSGLLGGLGKIAQSYLGGQGGGMLTSRLLDKFMPQKSGQQINMGQYGAYPNVTSQYNYALDR